MLVHAGSIEHLEQQFSLCLHDLAALVLAGAAVS